MNKAFPISLSNKRTEKLFFHDRYLRIYLFKNHNFKPQKLSELESGQDKKLWNWNPDFTIQWIYFGHVQV